MSPDLPPPDDLEEMLARRPCPEPSPGFRGRVLRAVAGARDGPWPVLWRVAAAIIVALNLWLAASNAARFQALAPLARAEHPMSPFETEAETKLANVARVPDAGPLARRLFGPEEDNEWDTH